MKTYPFDEFTKQVERIIPIKFFLLYSFMGEHRVFIATSELVYGYRGYICSFNTDMDFTFDQAMKTNEKIGKIMNEEDTIICQDFTSVLEFLEVKPYYDHKTEELLKKLLSSDEDD